MTLFKQATYLIIALVPAGLAQHAGPLQPAAQHASAAKPLSTLPDSNLGDVVRDRGTKNWGQEEVLLRLTSPPTQPVHVVPEWETAGAVVFAADSDFVDSLRFNDHVGTLSSPASLYSKDSKVIEQMTEDFCGQEEDSEDEDSSDSLQSARVAARKKKQEAYCDDGQLVPAIAERMFDKLKLAHEVLAAMNEISHVANVVLLFNSSGSNELELKRLADRMKKAPAGRELLSSGRFNFIQVPLNTKWVRDYGPFFVRDAHGVLTCIDTRYDPDAQLPENEAATLMRLLRASSSSDSDDADGDPGASDHTRLLDDMVPSRLAIKLRQRSGERLSAKPVPVARPPIALSGGDFVTDGAGTAFVSTETLMRNGSDSSILDEAMLRYFGIQHLVYLHALPGNTVKHLDMFLQAVAPNVFLLGEYRVKPKDAADLRLQGETERTLEQNLALIRDHYRSLGKQVVVTDTDQPSVNPRAINIIRVPMPPVVRPMIKAQETAEAQFLAAYKDAKNHQQLLDLLTKFGTALDALRKSAPALRELSAEAAGGHEVDEHDAETLLGIQKESTALSAVAGQYAGLTDEHEETADLLQASVKALDSLLTPLAKSAEDDKPFDAAQLRAAQAAEESVLKLAAGFVEQTKNDKAKDQFLLLIDAAKLSEIKTKLENQQQLYPYGTDLYLTYLNLLQVKTTQGMAVVVPSYREYAPESETNAAISRIRSVFEQLYGKVKMISVPSDASIRESGSIHCLTKVLPAGLEVAPSNWGLTSPPVDETTQATAGSAGNEP